jgi:hypothetical protein
MASLIAADGKLGFGERSDYRPRGENLSHQQGSSHFSKLVKRALGGEPQHATRYGKEGVVIVFERYVSGLLIGSRAVASMGMCWRQHPVT